MFAGTAEIFCPIFLGNKLQLEIEENSPAPLTCTASAFSVRISRVPKDAEDHGGFMTTNQIAMDLSDLHFYFHCYTKFCDFQDIKDLTPENYESKIKITVTQFGS